MGSTDKFLRKKAKELIAKDEGNSFHPISVASYYKESFVLSITSILIFILIPTAIILMPKGSFSLSGTGALIVGIVWLAFGFLGPYGFRTARNGKRLYDMVDKYRDALVDNSIRSIKDFCKVADTSPEEIIKELKELQEIELFRDFSIDRKNMKFIENADWGGTGSTKKISFACATCGANNSIYIEANSNTGVCEYCGSSSPSY